MTKLSRCACCKGALEPVQQLRFLVETDTLDDPAHLARIRALPSVNGKPVPVCKACHAKIAATPPRPRTPKPRAPFPPDLLGALGALSLGLLVSLFSDRG